MSAGQPSRHVDPVPTTIDAPDIAETRPSGQQNGVARVGESESDSQLDKTSNGTVTASRSAATSGQPLQEPADPVLPPVTAEKDLEGAAGDAPSEPSKETAKKRSWGSRLNPLKRSVVPPIPEQPSPSPEESAPWWSRASFWWMQPMMGVGYQRPIEPADIWTVNDRRSVVVLRQKLNDRFKFHSSAGSSRPLLRALFDTYRTELLWGGFCSFIASLITALTPFVLRYVIQFATASYVAAHTPGMAQPPVGEGAGYVTAMIMMILIQSMAFAQFFYHSAMVGCQARGSLTSLIFDKALRLSGRARAGMLLESAQKVKLDDKGGAENTDQFSDTDDEKKAVEPAIDERKKKKKSKVDIAIEKKLEAAAEGWSDGRIVNLMSTDTHRIELACGQMHMAWSLPLCVLVTSALLIVNLHASALAGLGLVFVSVPLLGRAMRIMFGRRKLINKITDGRVSLTQEILSAVRFVKLFAWERSFANRLDEHRKREIGAIKRLLMMRNGINAAAMTVPVFAGMLAFITFSLTGHTMEPGPVFSSLGLFNSLRMPMNMLPMVLGQVVDAAASISRIELFLSAEESGAGPDAPEEGEEAAVVLDDASFTWEHSGERIGKDKNKSKSKTKDKNKSDESVPDERARTPTAPFELKGVSLTFKPGELVAIVGAVGCGKSSLLAAIAGEMRQTGGRLAVAHTRAACPQSAWVENGTVRDNILFGAPYEEEAYNLVVDACALRPDFQQLPGGDQTEIGERGITVSGGQRQRIGVARTAYARVVGVLGDDLQPHNADLLLLDDPLAAVDGHVGRHIFEQAISSLLKGACRVLVTHQLWLLQRCDRIVWMRDGTVAGFGTLGELRLQHADFDAYVGESADAAARSGENEKKQGVEEKRESEAGDKDDDLPGGKPLMQMEDQAVKGIPMSVYADMLRRAGSLLVAPAILILLSVAMGTNVVTGLWLAWWTSHRWDYISDSVYAGVYAGLGVVQAVSLFAFAAGVALACTRASRALLAAAFANVLRAPVSFFDTTPLGRITNRFAKDVDALDNNIADAARIFLLTGGMIISTAVLVAVYFPPFLAALGPAAVVLVIATAYFRSTARELRRHESVFRSTVYARFSEGVDGAATVRAFGASDRMVQTIGRAIDRVNSASYISQASQRWLAVRSDAIGLVLVTVAAVLVIVRRRVVQPSISGLVLSYITVIAQMLQYSVRQLSEVETTMTAAERIGDYATKLPQEPQEPEAKYKDAVTNAWPPAGGVRFRNVEMRYRDGLPLVLKGLDLDIKPGERVALVGRTGAGKSSVLAALFRLTDPASGSIEIDGVDIRHVALSQLRSRLAIIPQDPVLFEGSIRTNLDPFSKRPDSALWRALQRAGLAGANSASSIHLDDPVSDGGSNFSLGQRQLLALARALVRTEARIVVCDEATSSVDPDTDEKVQHAMIAYLSRGTDTAGADEEDVEDAFSGPRTLITIAHRLRTVLAYDRVCMLDGGKIVELDSPVVLFENGGVFRSMCDRTGITREIVDSVRLGAGVA